MLRAKFAYNVRQPAYHVNMLLARTCPARNAQQGMLILFDPSTCTKSLLLSLRPSTLSSPPFDPLSGWRWGPSCYCCFAFLLPQFSRQERNRNLLKVRIRRGVYNTETKKTFWVPKIRSVGSVLLNLPNTLRPRCISSAFAHSHWAITVLMGAIDEAQWFRLRPWEMEPVPGRYGGCASFPRRGDSLSAYVIS
jgi:hypothetical protein